MSSIQDSEHMLIERRYVLPPSRQVQEWNMETMPESRPRHLCARITDKDMPDFVIEETRKFALCQTSFLCLVKGEQRKCVQASPSRDKSKTSVHFSSPGQRYKHD
jgi:hypothetical protein